MEAIAKNVKQWEPSSVSRQSSPSAEGGTEEGERSKESSPSADKDADLLTFDTFDLNQVNSLDRVCVQISCVEMSSFQG